MHIILGATGHVGSAVANALLAQGESVTIITHDTDKARDWQHKGARVAVADIHDRDTLRQVFNRGKRLFLLNPPAPPSTDTATEERKSIQVILAALDGASLEKIVAESTYGAQPGDRIGDLSVLYEMEEALHRQPIPVSIIRAAYYMSNWDASLQTAQQEGKVHTLYPPDFELPMVAPHDIGQVAARLMAEPVAKSGRHYVEGPQPYSSAAVAAAFSVALNKPVEAVQTPRDQWIATLKAMGFSDKAAESMANMTAVTLENLKKKQHSPDNPERGTTTLEGYIQQLVQANQK